MLAIKRRDSNAIILRSDVDTWRDHVFTIDMHNCALSGLDLTGSMFYNVNLTQSDLSHTDLTGVDFQFCNLLGANMDQAKLDTMRIIETMGDGKRIKGKIFNDCFVTVYDDRISIGDQNHRVSKWMKFNDDEIAKMDNHFDADDVIAWWHDNRDAIFDFYQNYRKVL